MITAKLWTCTRVRTDVKPHGGMRTQVFAHVEGDVYRTSPEEGTRDHDQRGRGCDGGGLLGAPLPDCQRLPRACRAWLPSPRGGAGFALVGARPEETPQYWKSPSVPTAVHCVASGDPACGLCPTGHSFTPWCRGPRPGAAATMGHLASCPPLCLSCSQGPQRRAEEEHSRWTREA